MWYSSDPLLQKKYATKTKDTNEFDDIFGLDQESKMVHPNCDLTNERVRLLLFIKSWNFNKSRDGINKNVWHLFTKSWDLLNRASLNRNLGVHRFIHGDIEEWTLYLKMSHDLVFKKLCWIKEKVSMKNESSLRKWVLLWFLKNIFRNASFITSLKIH